MFWMPPLWHTGILKNFVLVFGNLFQDVWMKTVLEVPLNTPGEDLTPLYPRAMFQLSPA